MIVFRKIDDKLNNALSGLYKAFRMEKSFILHFSIEIPAIVLGLLLGLSPIEWSVVLITISILLISELFNTALELFVKLQVKRYSELAEILLNISSGAVLLSVIFSIIIGSIIYIPYIIDLIENII